MSESSTTTTGPWRVLVLDRSADDAKWILAVVASPSDVRPAELGPGGVFAALPEIGAWVAAASGLHSAALTPMHCALAWRVDESR
jgi:hypothetical protein